MNDDFHSDYPAISTEIIHRISEDTSPALQVCSNAGGQPVVCNQTTTRFISGNKVTTWNSLIDSPDCECWMMMISRSCRDHTPTTGLFRLKRFDNVGRQFVLRAEPQYNSEGTFVCHITSGLDVTHYVGTGALAMPPRDGLQEAAQEWRDHLVSSATIIATSSDLLRDLLPEDSSPVVRDVVRKLVIAARGLREHLRGLTSIARTPSGKGQPTN